MTNTYNTGNPLGSTDARDLYDNASNMDDGMNSATPSFTDRLGVLRKTWNGLEAEFDLAQTGRASEFDTAQSARETEFQDFLVASGFTSLGNYAAGLNFTLYNQYMARDGFFYRPAPSSIPFTTTGTWIGGDENLFNLFSADDVLRQDLANAADPALGAALLGRGAVIVASVTALQLAKQDPSQSVQVRSYYSSAGYAGSSAAIAFGGGVFYWDATRNKSAHNGGSIISPTVPWDGLQSSIGAFLAGTGETAPGGVGVWVMISEVTATQFGAVGNGVVDDTASLNALIAARAGTIAFVPDGNYITTLQLDMDDAGTHLQLSDSATITYNTPNFVALRVTAENCKLSGGILGGWTGPESWDGTNVTPTYAAIWATGNGFTVDGIRMTNIKKLGVWFKDVENGFIRNSRLDANYPTELWTEVETVNFAVSFDPIDGDTGGNFSATGNLIRSAVQGIFAGNYGTGQEILGLNIVGNVFEGCWNHGIYSTGCRGASVTGNTFNRCQVPVALTGPYNTVTGNGIYTKFTGVGDLRDVTGISMRNPVGCVVSGNTIKGDAAASAVVIDFTVFDAGTPLNGNICANNVIEVAGGSSVAIRINSIATTTSDNIVEGNVVSSIGRVGNGVIQVNGTDGGSHIGNIVRGNSVTVRGESHAISITYQTGSDVSGNTSRFEYDAPSAKTLAGVLLTKCISCTINDNKVINTAAWGTNVTIRGVWEQVAGSLGSSSANNKSFIDMTKLAGFADFVILSGSNFLMDESGVGVPAYAAGLGSTFRRRDGGTSTSFYVRETAAGTTWVAK